MNPNDVLPTTTLGLADASRSEVMRLHDGDRCDLHIVPVRKTLDGADLRMLGYNGSIPGPTLHVDQHSEITVAATNGGDFDTTVHWHGVRLENRYDGVPHDTQAPIPVGGSFSYKVQFPDPGFYWYHPHMREDCAQELGLYGTIVVEPADQTYWPPADRHLTITLDDILIEQGQISPFFHSVTTHAAMGRFGNVMLINGERTFAGEATRGEVVRVFLVNTANTRIFNVGIRGARIKLVGGDSGRYERETFVDEVLIAPSERMVIDVLFDSVGDARLEHRTPERTYDLGAFAVTEGIAGDAAATFDVLRVNPEFAAQRQALAHDRDRTPDKVLAFVASMPLISGAEDEDASVTSYTCPMHPDVTSGEPGRCPKCGMRLQPASPQADGHGHGAHGAHSGTAHTHSHHQERHDGIEWEDLMPEINKASTSSNMMWKLVDRQTGLENGRIDWAFTVGDRVKIRLVNEMESDHPMHHPFHVHGAGRFLIMSRDGHPEANLVWKDTVLVRMGETVDILLEVTNPGIWMAHCHIAEHVESGMMLSFTVAPA